MCALKPAELCCGKVRQVQAAGEEQGSRARGGSLVFRYQRSPSPSHSAVVMRAQASEGFWGETDKLLPKRVWKFRGPGITTAILKRQEGVGGPQHWL